MTLKENITAWLQGRTFENSKHALGLFEKETQKKVSVIYFSRVFAEHVEACRKTKKDKVSDFIKTNITAYKTCEEMHKAYSATSNEVSLIYFSRVYTIVRKEVKPATAKQPKVVTLKGCTAGQIVKLVEDTTGEKMNVSLKNKKTVEKKAMSILTGKGYQIA